MKFTNLLSAAILAASTAFAGQALATDDYSGGSFGFQGDSYTTNYGAWEGDGSGWSSSDKYLEGSGWIDSYGNGNADVYVSTGTYGGVESEDYGYSDGVGTMEDGSAGVQGAAYDNDNGASFDAGAGSFAVNEGDWNGYGYGESESWKNVGAFGMADSDDGAYSASYSSTGTSGHVIAFDCSCGGAGGDVGSSEGGTVAGGGFAAAGPM